MRSYRESSRIFCFEFLFFWNAVSNLQVAVILGNTVMQLIIRVNILRCLCDIQLGLFLQNLQRIQVLLFVAQKCMPCGSVEVRVYKRNDLSVLE